MLDRHGSTDSNVFVTKGQELMQGSFHEDELNKSIISGKSKMQGEARRESLLSNANARGEVVVDWKEAISNKEG